MQMGIGQVPVMFAPDAPVVDTSAITVPDANSQAMFPAPFGGQLVPETPTEEIVLDVATDPRTWMWVGAGLVLWWAMRRG